MRPKLRLKPPNNSYYDILKKFNDGEPLSSDELNFLSRYHSKLSDPIFDRIFNYYHLFQKHASFVMPKGNFTLQTSKQFKDRIALSLQSDISSVQVEMTQEQLFQLKMLFGHEIIFFPGQLQVAGTWYLPSGYSHLEFFKWGKLFGVINYQLAPGEEPRITIHFENMANRRFEQCIDQYQHRTIKPSITPVQTNNRENSIDRVNLALQSSLLKPNPR